MRTVFEIKEKHVRGVLSVRGFASNEVMVSLLDFSPGNKQNLSSKQ